MQPPQVKIGIIREGKIPPDARVPLTPDQCREILEHYPNVRIAVQPSPIRCFKDDEYQAAGIPLQDDLSDCDVLLGVKEVPVANLLSEKTYLFFSHTIKKQPYNHQLLQTILEKKIRLIDYEVITDERDVRLIAFGYYAGVVGAHNGLWTYGKRTGLFELPRMNTCHDYEAVKKHYEQVLPPVKIIVTGAGRVASGAVQNLLDMGIKQVSPADFLANSYDFAVFAQITAEQYARHCDGNSFDKSHFYANGDQYESCFAPYAQAADIFLNCIYYDKKAPAFFTVAEMADPRFRIKVVADITCDIMPGASVPCTIRPSKIADPVFGFDPATGQECSPYQPASVDVMAIDNLPSELPRDASAFFGRQLIQNVLPELVKGRESAAIMRGMIAEKGALGPNFQYLEEWAMGSPVTT
jgi:saccharopine dehydrogenase (NAD+, L-lysine forming)